MENMNISQKSRLNFFVTAELINKLNNWAEKQGMKLSELARIALTEKVETLERNKREQEVAEACRKYRDFNKKFSSEWARFETRI